MLSTALSCSVQQMAFRSCLSGRPSTAVCRAVSPPCSLTRQLQTGAQQQLPALRLQPGVQLPRSRHQRRQQQCSALPQHAQQALLDLSSHPQVQQVAEVAEGLETPVQLIYVVTLLGFLVVGAYLIVRQVLIRRDLEEAAKVLGERIRTGSESSEDSFQLGVVLLRKKLFTQAVKHLQKAKENWGGDPDELAQVHNALGFAFFNIQKYDLAVQEYGEAVRKQPGYVTALNNLGDAYEKKKNFKQALETYKEALNYAPGNKIATSRVQELQRLV
mmetsp:Transcript_19887/g.60051  ORF Transcript_19887/g.60051 Transcript_19887/m.60051 type:complete len:273 (+) Transcript_19887:154-972(+)